MVARTAPFGAFVTVTLEDGTAADGLVHVSKIKDWQREMGRKNGRLTIEKIEDEQTIDCLQTMDKTADPLIIGKCVLMVD